MANMKSKVFIEKLIDVAKNYSTLYVMGCFGAPMTTANKTRYINNGASDGYNAQASRAAMIRAASANTFGFDCVCLIKGLLWGWTGDASKTYGGAGYAINGVPDIGADTMITKCTNVSTTGWANMTPGEALWCSGHIGVYIGDGLAVECTPKWKNCVQITAVANIGSKAGYNARTWTKHGKLPYVDYTDQAAQSATPTTSTATSLAFKVGDEVNFTGTKHYSNASAASGVACKPGKAKVTQVYPAGKHPYHLVAVAGGGSNVYGWVDAADIGGSTTTRTVAVGSTVTIKAGAVYGGLATSRGAKVPSYVSGSTRRYTVKKIATNKGVQEALLGEINSWVAISYLNVV